MTAKVYLIGAGPGAADLITVRGARLLARASVVLHDALVEPDMLALAPNARLIAVGKRCGRHSSAQHFINKQLVDAAQAQDDEQVVVRLKGGDPMLFGRADEEMRALEAAGIDYDVVPGVTASLASAASLKRSLTLRGVARSVVLATRSRAADSDEIQRRADADSLVYYMGRDQAPDIAREMIEAGRDAATPAVVVEACSTNRERSITVTLRALADGALADWFDASQPCTLLIGDAFRQRAIRAEAPASAEASAASKHEQGVAA
ncbi:uroporphyrin-III methyltransferase [Robbsia andropogonis]|uniref:uroporphyrinogen-III C-methyltransferase n=1 Tax=Robbsia andropogonis TaxID=28092 RepID=A0A0F5K5G1_9BURK|nr:uroporphyrinogen-III C-methyltransferase [Robbsia andropogonis]KKB65371.1 uroporphyrin-III methyltransferase [Robbsia andropogonis]MCP1121093.1 uroporphyrinogen-III C-methyltransferase [Robbsia andropogonis]MCP1130907.1 uroporphyrinogen-III C-methyltransferase [Robbsia andropogonis]